LDKILTLFFSSLPSWGYSIREPNVSAVMISLELPPPTTLIGAFAYGLAKALNLNYETKVVSKGRSLKYVTLTEEIYPSVVYAGASVSYYKTYVDVNRALIRPFQKETRERRENPIYQFGAISTGKVYLTGEIRGLIAFDYDKLLEIFKSLGAKDVERTIIESAYHIVRIGAKEGIVAVNEVNLGYARKLDSRSFKSRFYQRLEAVNYSERGVECDGEVGEYKIIRAWKGGFTSLGQNEILVAPICGRDYYYSGVGNFDLKENCIAYEFNGEGFAICL
jgi:CRISPR-associated protein Cas5a/b/c